ncbi:MAG: hypothetical protein ACOY0T_11625 [Myxococcota bacterium]
MRVPDFFRRQFTCVPEDVRPQWGGQREGAGRKPGLGRRNVAHRVRPAHRPDYPVLVTLRSHCRSMRTQFVFPTLRGAIAAANAAGGDHFRVCEFSVQGNHLHLLVEAESEEHLTRGIQGLAARIAKRVNRLLFQRGRFFVDRHHRMPLTTPRAVRNALVYVLANFRKHGPWRRGTLDLYSSAPYFLGFSEYNCLSPCSQEPNLIPRALAPPAALPVARAKTWLLCVGWKEFGLISLLDRPKT